MTSSRNIKVNQILEQAGKLIQSLQGSTVSVLEINKPPDLDYARHLVKVISKLSPIIANMIEFEIVSILNKIAWNSKGKWIRQDPGFPDALFSGDLFPEPGYEIKTWFPLATEITARFRDSRTFFNEENTNVALIAWLPEYVLYGKPMIVDVWIGTAQSLAVARDSHYHNPPDYLVIEPEDTSKRTQNLQQTNVSGYKFQGTPDEFSEASKEVASWGIKGKVYSGDKSYQTKLRKLMSQYRYRLDTNFAKIDRIQHEDLEKFKSNVLRREVLGISISEWSKGLVRRDEGLEKILDI